MGKKQSKQELEQEYFIRIPNHFIKCDIKKTFGISRKFYIVYSVISRLRSYEGYCYISIEKLVQLCGCKKINKEMPSYKEVLNVLEFMISKNMICINTHIIDIHTTDIKNINPSDLIGIKIVHEYFDAFSNGFTKLYPYQMDYIFTCGDAHLYQENVMAIFLYMLYYINSGDDANNGITTCAFYRSINCISHDLSMSNSTINKCLKFLTDKREDIEPLLIKEDPLRIGSQYDSVCSTPAIYVINKPGYQKEIYKAKNRLRELYYIYDKDISPSNSSEDKNDSWKYGSLQDSDSDGFDSEF